MKLQTELNLQPQLEGNQIDYTSKVLLLGSCFSKNIGQKFDFFKFQYTVNPFGILFHPKAIETFVKRVVFQQKYTETDLIFYNEQYHCFDAHSSLSNVNASVLVNNLNAILQNTHQQIKETTHLIITLGTSWVYHHLKTDKTVANCHKIPQQEFKKSILSVTEVSESIQHINTLLQTINSDIDIIYTVSPVRHLKDGFVENTQSKSHLASAIHQLNTKKVVYFPAYEIMMDELRDYRFYASDMLHPNETAIDYIWEQFRQVWLHKNTLQIMKEVTVIRNGLAHRPFNYNSKLHQEFIKNLTVKKEKLLKEFPYMCF